MQTNDHLKVHQAADADVYKDIVRIPELQRPLGVREVRIRKLYLLDKPNLSRFVSVRGIPTYYLASTKCLIKDPERAILMDEITRDRLNVKLDHAYKFEVVPAGWWGGFGWDASDPAVRIAFRLGIISLIIALIASALAEPLAWLWQPLSHSH